MTLSALRRSGPAPFHHPVAEGNPRVLDEKPTIRDSPLDHRQTQKKWKMPLR